MTKNYIADRMKEGGNSVRNADYKFAFGYLDEQPVLKYWRNLVESVGDEENTTNKDPRPKGRGIFRKARADGLGAAAHKAPPGS